MFYVMDMKSGHIGHVESCLGELLDERIWVSMLKEIKNTILILYFQFFVSVPIRLIQIHIVLFYPSESIKITCGRV